MRQRFPDHNFIAEGTWSITTDEVQQRQVVVPEKKRESKLQKALSSNEIGEVPYASVG